MYHILPLTSMLLVKRAHLRDSFCTYKFCLFNRNKAGAIRAGRDSIEPGLAEKLTYRNHELDELFTAETLILQQKQKKKGDDSSESDCSDDELTEDDGYNYVEKIRVNTISH